MSRAGATLVAVALAVGCKGEDLGALERVRHDVCTCATKACAEDAMRQLPPAPKHPSDKQQRLAKEILRCFADLSAAPAPSPAPPTPP